MATATKEKKDEKAPVKEPTRDELAKAAMKRAGLSENLSSYEPDQIKRAAESAPQRRGKALADFIMTGPKASKPRDQKVLNWDYSHKTEFAGQYALFASAKGKEAYRLAGHFAGNGLEGEKAMAKLLGVSHPDGLKKWTTEHDAFTVTARYYDRVDGLVEEVAAD